MDGEQIVIVVGSGASLSAGVPSTGDLTDVCIRALQAASDDARSPDSIAAMLDHALRSENRPYDFERLLHAVEELEAYVTRSPVIKAFTEVSPKYERIADRELLWRARRAIVGAIHGSVGGRVNDPAVLGSPATAQLDRICAELSKQHRLVVVDFNYDDLFDRMPIEWHDGFTESSPSGNGKLFSPGDWHAAAEDSGKHLLIHMHGSVRFGYSRDFYADRRFSEPAKYATFRDAHESMQGVSLSDDTVDDKIIEASAIISGLNKGSKIIHSARPYGYYYRTVMELLPRCRRLLVLGYGWRDLHVNTWVDECVSLQQGALRSAVVTCRRGRDVGEQMVQDTYIRKLLGSEGWKVAQSLVYKPEADSDKIASEFKVGQQGALFAWGFVLTPDAEKALVDFMQR